MEERSIRRCADPTTAARTAGPGPRAARRRPPARGIRIALGSLALGLMVTAAVATSVAGVASARQSGCRYAHRPPHHVSQRHARHAVVCVINQTRRHHGLRELHVRGALNRASGRHSAYMRRHGCFSHRCRGEGGLLARVQRTGYLPCGCTWGLAENIARAQARQATPAAIVGQWMRSPPHRAEILSRRLHDVGVGIAWGTARHPRATVGTYTADFGYRRG